jgi:hypothetical protein
VPEAGMIVAPVAPASLAESTTMSVKFGLTIAMMDLYSIWEPHFQFDPLGREKNRFSADIAQKPCIL